jgi:hypothetical protein
MSIRTCSDSIVNEYCTLRGKKTIVRSPTRPPARRRSHLSEDRMSRDAAVERHLKAAYWLSVSKFVIYRQLVLRLHPLHS